MASAPPTSRVPDVTLTDEQRADFARLCAQAGNDDTHGKADRIAAEARLQTLPPERARALVADLWPREESRRRVWARRQRWAFLLGLPVAVLVMFCEWLLSDWGRHLPESVLIAVLFPAGAMQFAATLILDRWPSRTQRGCIAVLIRHPFSNLAAPLIDVHEFARYNDRPLAHALLVRFLPLLATSDLPPLDAYQQNVLRREIKRYAGRVRKPTAKVDPAESAFVAAAMRYLSEIAAPRPAAPAEDKATAQTTALVQTLAALPPDADPNDAHCYVRAMARECLPRLTAGRQ